MHFVVIGLGSMGRRRIRLIRQLDNSIDIVGVDTNEARRFEASEGFGINTFASLAEAGEHDSLDAAFVCTSPESHHTLIQECLKADLHVFTELNLVSDGYASNIQEAKDRDKVLFLSSTFLYRQEIEYIKQAVGPAPLGVYRYHVGQYLPDWHPWEDYRDYFVANSRTNGCRELFAIELPWLCDIFGQIVDVAVKSKTCSELDLPYPDTYMLLLEHESGVIGSLMVDVVSRQAVRDFEYSSEEQYIRWGGTPSSLEYFDVATKRMCEVALCTENAAEQQTDYAAFIVEDAYLKEIEAFISAMQEHLTPRYSFEQDQRILACIDRIEEAT